MRVALVAGPEAGHLLPMAALATALQERGNEVTVVTGHRWERMLGERGLGFVPLPMKAEGVFGDDWASRLYTIQAALASQVADSVRPVNPDVVVADTLTLCGTFAAGLLGVPWCELIPHPLQDVSVGLPPPGTGFAPAHSWSGLLRDAFLRRLSRKAWQVAAGEKAVAWETVGVPAVPASLRMVCTFPVLEHPRPDWPALTTVVGPMELEASVGVLESPPGDGPLIVVSSSTVTGTDAPDLLEIALRVCTRLRSEGRPVRLVCTRFEPWRGELPSWAVVGSGAQGPLLDAAALMICGGGHGIVAKGLVRGLPLVMVPGPGEQYDNARRIARIGAGRFVMPHKLTDARLLSAVTTILDDGAYRAASARAAASASRLGPDFAAGLVERVARA